MKPISRRARRIPHSATLRILEITRELKKKGHDIISLSVGEPDFKTPQKIIDAAKEALDKGETNYAPSKGLPELREEIARKMREENKVPAEKDNILVTVAKHGIFMVAEAILQHGDDVIVPDPGWVSYIPISIFSGAHYIPLPAYEHNGFEPSIEDLQEIVSHKTKLLVLNTPSNPTGAVYHMKTLNAIADLAEDYDFYVLSDEIYEKLIYGRKHVSIASIGDMWERTITLNGFSKAYAMTGWRIGWISAKADIIDILDKIQQQTITCNPPFIQRAAITALRECAEDVKLMKKEFNKRRMAAIGRIDEMMVLDAFKPQGAFYIFARYHSHMNSFEVVEHLIREYGVAVTPGGSFGVHGEGYIRISYANSMEKLLEGLGRIEKGLSSLE